MAVALSGHQWLWPLAGPAIYRDTDYLWVPESARPALREARELPSKASS
jgi:hypothetical protein